jgi:hypothetical protein
VAGGASGGACTTDGEMKCGGTGFLTCVHKKYVDRPCAPGTKCHPNGASIICK